MAKGESKSYNPAEHERRIFAMWEEGGFFHPEPDERPREERFSMVIPPPNVTGALHLGHALNNTLQDILVRRRRMQGRNTFWLVGTDHAGIGTQAVVEKHIRKTEGKSRHDLGPTPEASREELVRRIWAWKEQYGGRIIEQLKLMGCSCDYGRERFTLDEGCVRAVRETFFKMFRDGLIYRGKRLVNWDTQLQTAVADDEVYHEEVKGHFYHFKYPIVGEHRPPAGTNGESTTERTGGTPMLPENAVFGRDYILIATTRPETMLADTAVAVHPEPDAALEVAETQLQVKLREASEKERPAIKAQLADIAERKTTLLPTLLKLRDMAKARTGSAGVSPAIMLPLLNRPIPLILDKWADPTLGSGCVKITPAHDMNDYEVGKRHNLPMVNMLTPDGRVNENGGAYQGMKLGDARKKIVADLESLGLVEKIEDRLIDLAHSDRSNTPIEPYLSDQWFVKMGDLTEEEAARIQTPFLKEYIERARIEPGSSGCKSGSVSATTPDGKPETSEAGFRKESASTSVAGPLPHGRGSDRLLPGLAQMAIDAVKRGDFRFQPARYEKTYLDWLGEKRDWCISRQLWWGHRIPVWSLKPGVRWPAPNQAYWGQGPDPKLLDQLSIEFFKAPYLQAVWDGSPISPALEAQFAERTHFVCLREEPTAHDRMILDQAGYQQDPDVLDTWFSSALWPHSTMGWPEGFGTEPRPSGSGFENSGPPDGRGDITPRQRRGLRDTRGADQTAGGTPTLPGTAGGTPTLPGTPGGTPTLPGSLLGYYHPTDVLSTAREIITLWVARMVITGLYNVGQAPFRDVVIHPVIQDGQGRKMSKSLGNGVDPVDIIEEYGADALRYTLAELATETQDIRMPVKAKKLPDGRTINVSEKFEKGRNFCNKLWQAATGFVIPNLEGYAPRPLDPTKLHEFDRWILSRMTACIEMVNEALDRFRFSEAVGAAYRFMWDEYCSWYIEMTKPRLSDPSRAAAQQVLAHVLDQLLRILHPVIPFITEALWAELNKAAPRRGLRRPEACEQHLVNAAWPAADGSLQDDAVEQRVGVIHDIIRSVRDIRTVVNEYRVRAKQPSIRTLPRVMVRADAATCRQIEPHQGFICPLAGCDEMSIGHDLTQAAGSMNRVCGAIEVFAPVGDLVDLGAVRRSERQKLDELRGVLTREEGRLANPDFAQRADPGVVEQARQRAEELSWQIRLLESHLAEGRG